MNWDPTQWNWQHINSFSGWFEAFGTIAAVLVALYLARRQDQIQLRAKAYLQTFVGFSFVDGKPGDVVYLVIKVTNAGRRAAVLTGIEWTSGRFAKKRYAWKHPTHAGAPKLPVRMRDGEHVEFWGPLDDPILDWLARDIDGTLRSIRARSIRVGAVSSAGETIMCRVNKSVRDAIVNRMTTRMDTV